MPQLSEIGDLNVTLTAQSWVGDSYESWTNITIYYRVNSEPWNSSQIGSIQGLRTVSFNIDEGNYSKGDDLYYYFHLIQFHDSTVLQNYYWTQDGLTTNETEAKTDAFHKSVGPMLSGLSLNYGIWYSAQLETTLQSSQGGNISKFPWIRINTEDLSLNFANTTSTLEYFNMTCINRSHLNHDIHEASKNISKVDGPIFNYTDGINSPFVLNLNQSYIINASMLSIPKIIYDAYYSNSSLTFSGEILNVTYGGSENWPFPHRTVEMFYSGNETVIKFDSYTGIMVYFKHDWGTVNHRKSIILALIDNNQNYPINLQVEKRIELVDVNFAFIEDHPLMILYDPPGDHSFSQYTQGLKITQGVTVESGFGRANWTEGFSYGMDPQTLYDWATPLKSVINGIENWGRWNEFLLECMASLPPSAESWHTTASITETTSYDASLELSFSETFTSSLNSDNPLLIGQGRGDLYYGAALIVVCFFFRENFYIVVNTSDQANNPIDDICVWSNKTWIEQGLALESQFTVLGSYLDQYNMTHLESYNIFADNQLSENETSFVEKVYGPATFWTPGYLTEIVSSYTSSVTTKYTLEYKVSEEILEYWNKESNGFDEIPVAGEYIKAIGTIFELDEFVHYETEEKIGYTLEFSTETTNYTSTEESREIMCHLEDDDGAPIGEHDQFLMDIYKDLRYGTFGYIIHENFTYTSRPYEIGTRDRRSPTISELMDLNDYLSGSTNLTCIAVDEETGVDYVQFFWDDDPIFDANSTQIGNQSTHSQLDASLYQLSWDTSSYNGLFYLFAVTYDNAGTSQNWRVSSAYLVHIDNVDPISCQIITYGPYSAAIDLYSNSLDADSGIAYVEYWDGDPDLPGSVLLGISSNSAGAYHFIWATDPSGTDDGVHTVYTRAYDMAGNYLTSTPVIITVDNSDTGGPTDTGDWLPIAVLIAGIAVASALVVMGILVRSRSVPPPPKKHLPAPKKSISGKKLDSKKLDDINTDLKAIRKLLEKN